MPYNQIRNSDCTVLIESLEMVDEVIIGTEMTLGLDFEQAFRSIKPQILAVTEV